MLIEAEFERKDGTWRKARLWVDTGNPDFLISEEFAQDMGIGIDTGNAGQIAERQMKVRIGSKPVNFDGIKVVVGSGIQWLFNTMQIDGNVPSTVLQKYQVVFDYPLQQIILAEPGILTPRGVRSPARINPVTGIVQMDAVIDGENYSFALDNGSSFSFVSDDMVAKLIQRNPKWLSSKGAVGCANIWGYWPEEETWPLLRLPVFQWGNVTITDAVIAGLPPFFRGNTDVGTWYSRKSARPVNGFLGPNVFKAYRVEIVYADSAVYFEKGTGTDIQDMDMVGLTLRPLEDQRWAVIGIVNKDGKPIVEGIEKGDILLQVGNLKTTGATMGTVIDALRGTPGERKILLLEREGKPFTVKAEVERFL